MNKVIIIHLRGAAYQLEEPGYDALKEYLRSASDRLKGNPDCDEILADIEQAISDKFRSLLNPYKTVILANEVGAVLAEMGPIEGDSGGGTERETARETGSRPGPGPQAADSHEPERAPMKRLYRIEEGSMIAGVCNGLAAYFHIDPTLVRLAFVLLTFLWGASIVVYIVMAIVVPSADSPEEKAAAFGAPFTAQGFIHRAKQGYYNSLKTLKENEIRKRWTRKFQQRMQGWSQGMQREMTSRAAPWQTPPAVAYALPFFSLLHGILAIGFIASIVSLLATGRLLGTDAFPPGVPLWIELLLIFFMYGFLSWPLKAVRRGVYGGPFHGSKWAIPFICVADLLVWIAVAFTVIYLGIRYLPQFKEAMEHLPGFVRDTAESFKQMFEQKH